jgi:hypothetical protein
MSTTTLGRPGNNPFCHHRAFEMARRGQREGVVPVSAAPGVPFDHGTFEIVVETVDGGNAIMIGKLLPCSVCTRHVRIDEERCPFCGADGPAGRSRPRRRRWFGRRR